MTVRRSTTRRPAIQRPTAPWSRLLILVAMATIPVAAAADDMLEFVGEYTPPFFVHLLDVQLEGTIAYVPGYSGLTVYDIGAPAPPAYLGRYRAPNTTHFYHATSSSPYTFCAARLKGVWVIDVSNPGSPLSFSSHAEPGVSYEGVLLDGSDLYVAAHETGLRIYDVTDPASFVPRGSVTALTNAWAVAKEGDWLYVADGDGGLRVVDCTDPDSPQLVATAPTSGNAQDVVLRGGRAYVACASAGMDIFDIQDRANPQLLGTYTSPHASFLLAADPQAQRVYIAAWNVLEAVDVSNPAAPVRVGLEDTPTRAMGVAADGNHVYVADWSSFRMYAFGPTIEPDVQVEPTSVSLPVIPFGLPTDTTLTISNTGGGTLQVLDIQAEHGDFAAAPTSFTLPPDGSQQVTLTVTPTLLQRASRLHILSDDPDEADRALLVDYGTVGSFAPDFTLDDLQGASHSLIDYLGEVVLLAFFASW